MVHRSLSRRLKERHCTCPKPSRPGSLNETFQLLLNPKKKKQLWALPPLLSYSFVCPNLLKKQFGLCPSHALNVSQH
ncbi:Zinc-type alcohol dehydrogenase-like protein C16A3.02c [Fusarium oxysporum f. sp. albedinis]|nr:Zinc-type alcohol dehydrogenase-like protein C16A3.02c [Fusarium oxysporum f. sp. albedinis]